MPGLSVLIVDDDLDIATNVSDILNEFGYEVATANDGKEALAKVRGQQFDVALLDFKMPDMDGATLYEQIRKIQPQIVAIMVTAYAGSDGVDRAINAGVWQVLRKPVDVQDLLSKIGGVSKLPLILVVDDDEDFCASLWEVLREQDYRVGIAHSDEEARKLCKAHEFDVLLLDVHLGDHTSETLLRNLASLNEGSVPRTILITGKRESFDESSDSDLRENADSVFFKPLPIGELLKEIETLLPKS